MPRIARAVAPGYPHYIVQKGNNREDVFFTPEDRAVYLYLLKKYADRWNVAIMSYCLMSSHVHLLTIPKTDKSLQKMMQGITLCYTQHVNRKHGRTGRLWESRFSSCIVDRERYLWTVSKYIEQDPVRSEMVASPELHSYSSAPAHFGIVEDPILGEELFTEAERNDYIEFLLSGISAEQAEAIRTSLSTGRPLGPPDFVAVIEDMLKKRLTPLPVGRPKKDAPANPR